ncbi:ABC transporter ATP-binding protein/permease [Vagococcus sp. JNUCC 83]
MINKQLMNLLKDDKKYIVGIVLSKWATLLANIATVSIVCVTLAQYYTKNKVSSLMLISFVGVIVVSLIVKSIANNWQAHCTHFASSRLRLDVRKAVLTKSLNVDVRHQTLNDTELTQLSVEGVEQLEHYFSRFIPQFFYCLLSSLTVFFVLAFMYLKPAIMLLLCIPLIPLSIVAIMKIAKRILGEYWDGYLILGEQFYENLMGLTTLKIFSQDGMKQREMDQRAETFRQATMNLLKMQLNSLIVMDIIAYGGAAIGIVLALSGYVNGMISLTQMLIFILLAAEFFIPLRQLGSFFHVAMNGISASKRLFDYLESPDSEIFQVNRDKNVAIPVRLVLEQVSFSYDDDDSYALKKVSTVFEKGHIYGVIGQSGSGKSTLSKLLTGEYTTPLGMINGYDNQGHLLSLSDMQDDIVVVNQKSYLFEGTIKDNLLMGRPDATDDDLWQVLDDVKLAEFFKEQSEQLEYLVQTNGKNLSGGQRQRLLLARALLSDKAIYIFDEITSSVDSQSEQAMLEAISLLSVDKIVIFISHRLYTVKEMDHILVFSDGELLVAGTHNELVKQSSLYNSFLLSEKELLGRDEDE